ncbi:MFS transporter [Acidianus ambivalens]|uniref:MFS transporter n=1 Tax=Acidianus ambivalens TaxID=2283 RepID=A0A650CT91_ACIAM|nr:MFS transporter [Acidianus ambivalens]MQL55494.1 MFS transporter [Acidianus ambivalens]QGR21026.1 MFS transporter [Acidianus ambivalens]
MDVERELRILIITSLAHFNNDGTFLIFPLLIVYYSTVDRISLVILGAMSIIYTLLSGLLSPLIGDFADKHNIDSALMSLGIFLEGAAIGLFGISFMFPSIALIALGSTLLGIGQAFYHPIGGAILSRTFGKEAGRALGINGSLGSLGRSLMPSIVTFLILGLGEITGLLTVSAYMVLSAMIIFVGLKFYKRESIDVRKSKEKLEKVFYKFLLILGSIVFIRSMFITGTTTFVGEFVYDVYHSKELAGIFLTIGFLGSVLGQPAFGWLTERKGGRYAFIVSSLLTIVTFIGFLVFAENLIISLSFYTIFTFSAFSSFPVLLGYVSQTFPKNFYTVANSYIWGIGVTVGGAAGNALITALLGLRYTILSSFYVMLGLAIFSAILMPLIPKRVSTA